MRNVALLLVLLGLLASFFAGRWSKKAETIEVVTETRDTLYLRDTLIVEVAAAPCYITRVEEVYVPVTDTLRIQDTIYAVLDRTTLRYEDSTYTAVVSGIEPRLDSLTIYPQRELITIHTTERVAVPKRWGVGINAGYGVTVAGGMIQPAPYIGIGVSYNLVSW